jgi:aspartyl-tRNA synthetase
MTRKFRIQDLVNLVDQSVTIYGWVDTIRDQKSVQFVIIRDETGKVQVVHDRQENPDLAEVIGQLSTDSVVEVTGKVIADERVKLGGLELRVESFKILSKADDLPINEQSNLDKRLDWRFIDLRSRRNQLIFQAQTILENEFRRHCQDEGLIEINSPKLMASPSESRSELFQVKYFDRTAYLAQSPQFYKQMGIASGFPGVFETGPVFRANPSFTSRHDTEFTSLDVEIAWVSSHEDVMSFEERLLRRAIEAIKSSLGPELESEFGTPITVPQLPFPRIPHAEAIRLVKEAGYEIPRSDGDLDPEAERRLSENLMKTTGHEFVFVTDYPSSVRPFYHMRYEDAPTVTKSFDLIWKGLEITTGAQREHRYEILKSQVLDKGLDPQSLDFYLDFFRFGCPPHGGFGLGLTRLLMILLGVANVREVTYLYRGPNRLVP